MRAIEPTDAPRRLAGLSAREWTVVAIGLAVATLPAVMPVMVGALAAQPGIGIAMAGYIVSANMGGIFAGTLGCVLLRRYVSVSNLLLGGLIVMVAGNILTMLSSAAIPIFICRLLSGVGEGVAAAICYALMGQSHKPARSLAFYVAGQGVVGAIGMAGLPILIALYGWRSFYLAVSIVALPAMLATRFVTRGTALEAHRSRQGPVGIMPAIMLLSILMFFTGMGSLWAFMEPIGRQLGLDVGRIASALSASAIAQLTGSLLVSAVGDRLSARTATVVGILMIGGTAAGLSVGGFPPFLIGVCVLNFAWGFLFPFLFRSMVEIDRHGAAALTPMATGAGLMIGPALGGAMMQHLGTSAVAATFSCLTVAGLLLSFFTNRQGVRTMPTGPKAATLQPSTHHA